MAIKVPENGYLADDGGGGPGWVCDRTFKAVGEKCVAIEVPANGYLTGAAFGPRWKCNRGYVSDEKSCVAVKVPKNAHLEYFGHGWECDPPYRQQRGKCVPPDS